MTQAGESPRNLLEQARLARSRGNAVQVREFAGQAEAAAHASNDPAGVGLALAMQARAHRDAGMTEAARELLVQAEAVFPGEIERDAKPGEPLQEYAYVLRQLADVTRETGRDSEAMELYDRTLRLLLADDATPTLTRANTLRGRALAAEKLGWKSQAREDFSSAAELYREVHVAAGVEECERRLALQK